MPVYSNHLREIIKKGIDSKKDYDKPLTGFKIAVDAGNGSGGFLATDVLAPLGADTVGVILFLPWLVLRQQHVSFDHANIYLSHFGLCTLSIPALD